MKYQNYFFIFLLILSFILVKDYISYLLFSLIIYGLSYPIFNKINKYIRIRSLSAFISIFIIFLIFFTAIYLVFYNLYRELSTVFPYLLVISEKYKIVEYLPTMSSHILKAIYNILTEISKELLGYIISLFTSYYLLFYSNEIGKYFEKYNVLNIENLKNKFYGIFIGYFLFWTLQALLSYIGFLFLGIKYSILLSILVFIFAILPIFGPWTVWISIAIYFFLIKNYLFAIISIVYGIIFISFLTEILFKPLIVGKYSGINSLLVFLGIVGGISVFGISGMFIGPLILEITKDYLLEYLKREK